MDTTIKSSEQIALFCRLNTHTKRKLPIRSSEMGMLIYLVKTEEEKTPNAVSKFFKVTKSMATNMTTSLLKKGYIEKQQSAADKRSVLLRPTEKAIQLVNNTYEEYFKTMSILEIRMGKQKFTKLITLIEEANTILLEERSNG